MGLFRTKLVDKYVAEWQFEKYAFLIRNFSDAKALSESDLWLPTPEHFGTEKAGGRTLSGRALAKFLFNTVAEQCRFGSKHGIKLIPSVERKSQQVGETTFVRTDAEAACGRYMWDDLPDGSIANERITYDRDLTEQPQNLIATFAHEFSHALHMRARESHDDLDPELYEMFTDLTAIYLGYGVFIANSRFEFSGFQGGTTFGWQANGAGYLPEADIIFGLAIFMLVKGIPEARASEHLKPRLQKMLSKAFKQLKHHDDDLEVLRQLEPLPNPPSF